MIWIYLFLVDGEEDDSKHYEERGRFTADGTEIQLIPEKGDTKTYQYVIPTSGLIDMILTDLDGVEWIFNYKEAAW